MVDPIDGDAMVLLFYTEDNAMRIVDEVTDLDRSELFVFGN